jgi:hypothetical protein
MKEIHSNNKAFVDILDSFQQLNLPLLEVRAEENILAINSEVNRESFYMNIWAGLYLDLNLASVHVFFPHQVPRNKLQVLRDLIEASNEHKIMAPLQLSEKTEELVVRTAMPLSGEHLDKYAFKVALKELMCTACMFYEFILKKKLKDLPEEKRKEQFSKSHCNFCPMK